MFRQLAYILLLLTSSLWAKAQLLPADPFIRQLKTPIPDSTRIRLLLQLGEWYLQRSSETKDLDSVVLLSHQAARLCRKTYDTRRGEIATVLMGRAYAKENKLDLVRTLLGTLGDTSRVHLILETVYWEMGAMDADTAFSYCSQAISTSQRLNIPRLEAEAWEWQSALYYRRNNQEKARSSMLRGWSMARHSRDISAEVRYLMFMASISSKDTAMDSHARQASHDLLQDALTLLHPTDPPEQLSPLIYSFAVAGNQYANTGNVHLGLNVIRDAIALNKGLHQSNPWPIGILSSFETKQGDLQNALRHALEAERLNESAPPAMAYTIGYRATASVYNALGDLQRSLDYYNKALDIYFRYPYAAGDPNTTCKRVTNLYIKLGRPAEALVFLDSARKGLLAENPRCYQMIAESQGDCSFALRQYKNAEKYYLESLKYTSPTTPSDRFLTYLSLARVYVTMGQFAKSRPWLSALCADSNRLLVNLIDRRDAFFLSYQADSATGDFRAGTAHLRQYQQLNDSLFNTTRDRQLTEMTTRYETEKKDRNIARLNTEASLREADLRNIRLLRNGFIVGSILLVLLLALLYNRYRLKQRSNALLKAQREELDASNHRLTDLNARQQRLLQEKEWLMREIHHRVKNNLQLVISLLNMQASTLKDELALNAFGDIRSRIRAISLIHNKLYQEGQDIMRIDMREYVNELTGFLEDSFSLRRRIRFALDVDALDLDVSQCVPIGLVLNEAVTNAIKYAFPDVNASILPTISISLKEETGNMIRLVVSDNGIGLPSGFDLESTRSMGLQLIRTLSIQLEGFLDISKGPGMNISILFPREPASVAGPINQIPISNPYT